MATEALYRKWRPRTFDEVIGQDHVTRTLRNALAAERVAHAYLFAGPRGTGKTTTARLLAKAVNCLGEGEKKPCGECRICRAVEENRLIDMIEIDAASNRGIDEIRDLREKVGFRPGEADVKFYIIDEVHMLTDPAFNALLKTLEEPPPHVIFVLATTEPHKIPATIISRCQRFDFRRIPVSDMTLWLAHIAAKENLDIEPPALQYIAQQGSGSLRDAISLLDQITAYSSDTITLAHVQAMLGAVASQSVVGLVNCMIQGEVSEGLELINRSIGDGAEPRQFTRDVVEHLRGLLLLKMGNGAGLLRASVTDEDLKCMQGQAARLSPRWLLRATRLFNTAAQEMKTGFLPQLPLELAFVESSVDEMTVEVTPAPSTATDTQSLERAQVGRSGIETPTLPQPTPPPARVVTESPTTYDTPPAARDAVGEISLEMLESNWRTILADLRQVDSMTQGLMNSVKLVGVDGNTLIVEAPSELLKGRIEQPRVRSHAEPCISQAIGTPVRLRCVAKGEYRSATQSPPSPAPAGETTQHHSQENPQPAPDSNAEEVNTTPDNSGLQDDPLLQEGLSLGGVIRETET
jgi:DNA polymerase-3 subunit gamma/tau